MRKIPWIQTISKHSGLIVGLLLFSLVLALPTGGEFSVSIRNMLAIAVLMAVWWMTEALPLAITSLVPLALYPFLGIMKTGAVAPNYAHHLIFLFMGGFIIAIALQEWQLHRRFALAIITLIGSNPRRIILGFMLSAAILSMWISNTATTIMMLPIGLAVIKHLQSAEDNPTNTKLFGMVLMLGIAYSSSMGGIATLIGTPPNVVFSGIYEKFFPELTEVTFVQWMTMALPLSGLLFISVWLYLVYGVLDKKHLPITPGKGFFVQQRNKLQKMNPPQKMVVIIFGFTAFLWIFRSNIDLGTFVIPGWPNVLGLSGKIQDSTIAIAMSILLFIIPVQHEGQTRPLLQGNKILELPWDILLLFGGGFALADGIQQSGLAAFLGSHLVFLGSMPLFLVLFILTISVAMLTEFTSNTAVATTILPVLAALSIDLNIDPRLFMMPATIAASCAFMLPVATPPNAIVFGSRLIPIKSMVRIGIILNLVISVVVSTYFYVYFELL